MNEAELLALAKKETQECLRCAIVTAHISWASDPYTVLNLRSNTWHIEAESGYGKTECGKDATGPNWGWPE